MWTGFYVKRNNAKLQTKRNKVRIEATSGVFFDDSGDAKPSTRPFGFSISSNQHWKTKWAHDHIFFNTNFQNHFHKFIIEMMANAFINKLNVFLWYFFVVKYWKLLNFLNLFDVTPRGVHSMFAIVELIWIYMCLVLNNLVFWLFSMPKENVNITFAMMRHLIFLMRFTPEERAIVLEMAKNCLSKHNLTFSFSFNSTEKHQNWQFI